MTDPTTSDAKSPRPDAPTADADASAALSEAAREAVRQPADPRIDSHLASLGLTDAPAPRRSTRARADATSTAAPAVPTTPIRDLGPEVGRLETQVAALKTALAATTARVRMLVWALVFVGLVAVAALVLALR